MCTGNDYGIGSERSTGEMRRAQAFTGKQLEEKETSKQRRLVK